MTRIPSIVTSSLGSSVLPTGVVSSFRHHNSRLLFLMESHNRVIDHAGDVLVAAIEEMA